MNSMVRNLPLYHNPNFISIRQVDIVGPQYPIYTLHGIHPKNFYAPSMFFSFDFIPYMDTMYFSSLFDLCPFRCLIGSMRHNKFARAPKCSFIRSFHAIKANIIDPLLFHELSHTHNKNDNNNNNNNRNINAIWLIRNLLITACFDVCNSECVIVKVVNIEFGTTSCIIHPCFYIRLIIKENWKFLLKMA